MAAVARQRIVNALYIPAVRFGSSRLRLSLSSQALPRTQQCSHDRSLRSQIRWSSESSSTDYSRKYTFEDISARVAQTEGPSKADASAPPLIIIDVREPSELAVTGRIPSAQNLPISSLPAGLFLPPEEFRDKFGFEKPAPGSQVVFYCKAGVRSRTAAAMVGPEWSRQGVEVGEFPGSWNEWAARGGKVER